MNPLVIVWALALEAVAVAAMWGAFEIATHDWGRWVAIGVALGALPFLLVTSRQSR